MPASRSNTCLDGGLADDALLLGQRARARPRPATERHRKEGTVSSSTFFSARRHAGLAEILLRQDVGRDLRPERRHLDVVRLEHDRAVRIADLGRGQPEFDLRVGRLPVLGEAPFDPHSLPLLGADGLCEETPPNISRRRVFCERGPVPSAPCEPGWPGALFNVPVSPAPSGTGPITAVDPPCRATRNPPRAEADCLGGSRSRTLFGSVRRALGTAPRRTTRTLGRLPPPVKQ